MVITLSCHSLCCHFSFVTHCLLLWVATTTATILNWPLHCYYWVSIFIAICHSHCYDFEFSPHCDYFSLTSIYYIEFLPSKLLPDVTLIAMTVSFHLQCFFARCHSHCYDCEFPPLLPIAVTMSLHLHYGYLSVFIKLSFHFHCYCPDVTLIAMAMSFHSLWLLVTWQFLLHWVSNFAVTTCQQTQMLVLLILQGQRHRKLWKQKEISPSLLTCWLKQQCSPRNRASGSVSVTIQWLPIHPS